VAESVSFQGTLLDVPFGPHAVRSVAAEQYRVLLADREPEDVLVLTGSPTSSATFREVLREECPGAAVPHVTSVVVHATDVINRTDDRAILSDAMRRELVHRFLEEWEWETEYLQRAAEQESFTGDIARLLETATWQNVRFDTTPELREVSMVRDAFHAWFDDHDHLERGQMIAEATDVLSEPDQRDALVDAEAILAIEFEEFVASDRRYLQTLADERDLVCLAENDASIRRTWTEAGPITEHVSFSEHRSTDPSPPATRPAATAGYFARGTAAADPDAGDVSILAAETADDELERVADEIEQLREQQDLDDDDIAVALKYSGRAVIDVVQAFEQAGIPTTSATVVGFGDDPAIRELLQVVSELASDTDLDSELTAGAAAVDDGLQDELAAMPHLGNALRNWATESNVKQRVAADGRPLDARAQFGNLRRAFAMADFLEDTAFLDASWASLAKMLRRAHEYAPQENQTSAIDDEDEGGVRVDHLRALKNGSFRVVFVLDVVDDTYPGEPRVNSLFPRERVTRMPDYPGVTQVDAATVEATFATESTRSSRPFRQYHAEHARRQLAIGASIAGERVYFCLHRHAGTALDERVQPSRYLTDAYRSLPWLTEADEPAITTERAAEEYLLSRIDRALADVRRTNSQDVTVSLDDVEAEVAEIQAVLDESGDRGEQLREALRARVDFAAGRVRRE
jgi:hypothetical protein